jgi:hypothetical protein
LQLQGFVVVFVAEVLIVAPPFISSHEANDSHFACTLLAICDLITRLVEYQ